MSTNPLNPEQQKQVSRLLAEIEKQRLDKPRTETVLDAVRYHSSAEQLSEPLYVAKAQQETQKQQAKAKKAPAKKGGQKLTKEDVQTFAPLLFDQIDHYEGLVKMLLNCKLPQGDKDDLTKIMDELMMMKQKGHLTPQEAKMLQEIIETLNEEYSGKLSPEEKKSYWAQVATMYDEVHQKSKKLGSEAKTKSAQQLGKLLGDQAAEDKGAAEAKQQGHESLAQMFIDAILGKFMPNAEGQLMDIALFLQFQNFGATSLDDLLGSINDFGAATNDFNISTLTGGSTPPKYKDGQQLIDAIKKERQALARDLNEMGDLKKGISDKIKEIDDRLKGSVGPPRIPKETDSAVIKGLNDLKSTLQQQFVQCDSATTDLHNLQRLIGGPDNEPKGYITPGMPPDPAIGPDGSVTINGLDGEKDANGKVIIPDISTIEDAVKNGTSAGEGKTATGGLLNIYNSLKDKQQDYSNQSSSEQMKLQLTMTEVQQMWTVVSTCMTTLNQAVMTLSQSIYK